MNYKIIKTDHSTNFESIKELYYQTWTFSYADLVPQDFLNQLDKSIWHPEKRWNNTLIAVTPDNQIISVCSYGPARKKQYIGYGEIYSLYILPHYQHLGIGQKLFQSVLTILEQEYKKIYLIVLKNNLAAQGFYEKFDFQRLNILLKDTTDYGTLLETIMIKE